MCCLPLPHTQPHTVVPDLVADGWPDIVSGASAASMVTIHWGDRLASFVSRRNVTLPSTNPSIDSLAVADLDSGTLPPVHAGG